MSEAGAVEQNPHSAAAGAGGWPRPAYAWYVVAVISFGYVFAFIDRIIIGLLTPAIQADLGLSDSEAGWLQGMAFALFYASFGLPLGWLADRWKRQRLLVFGMTTWSAMTVVCGMATGFWSLFFARAGVGIGEATLSPCTSSLIGDYFPPQTRAKAFGVYVMAASVATGVTYLLGGIVVGALQDYPSIHVPLLGELKPWQAAFVIVGLPGLIPAVLFMLTVREPVRRDSLASRGNQVSFAETRRFLAANRTTLICQYTGIALVLMAIYGWLNWMPSYFLRVHGWQPAKVGFYYGIFGGLCGIISAISAGWIASWFRRKGLADAPLRICLIGGLGGTAGAALAPLMPNAELAMTLYVLTGLFANYAPVGALAAINDFVPNEMRALITAIYTLIVGVVSSGLGTFAVGWMTDNVFADRQAIGLSLAAVAAVAGTMGCIALAVGLKPYRASVERMIPRR